jgi:hypothetical protein
MKEKLIYFYRWLMWNLLSRPFVSLSIKPKYRYARTPDSQPFPRPPFILIANHGTFFDPWMIGVFSPYPIAYMCNDDAFRGSAISQWYLKSIGAFPKKKGASDFKAMKTTIGLLRNGYPVGIFPEGQTTWDGETQLLYRGIEKILKKAACPLVLARIRGNFLTKPWWADTMRKGRILISLQVLSADVLAAMSDDRLFEIIKAGIYQNDITDESNRKASFSGNDLAVGLERFVWMCMHCGSEDSLVTTGNHIRCRSCEKSWQIDAWCRLKPERGDVGSFVDINEWAAWHREKVIERVHRADAKTILAQTPKTALLTEDDQHRFLNRGTGRLTLTKDNLSFEPDDITMPTLRFPVGDIQNQVIQRKDVFEITVRGIDYRFAFDHRSPMKWMYYVRYVKGYEECEKRGFL